MDTFISEQKIRTTPSDSYAYPVVNPDGTNINGGAFTDSDYGVPVTPTTQRVAAMLGLGAGAVTNLNPVPVSIVDAAGTVINITTGDIDIHTTHNGAVPDSIRIGDGTTELDINADGSITAVPAIPTATSPTILNGYVVGVLAVNTASGTIFTTDVSGATSLSWDNNSGSIIEITAGATIIAKILPGSSSTMSMKIAPSVAITITPRIVGLSATDYVAVRVS